MSEQNTNSVSINQRFNVATQMSSMAVWNKQFRLLERDVNRLMLFHKIKPAGMLIVGEAGSGKTHFARKFQAQKNELVEKVAYCDYKPVLLISAPKRSTVNAIVEVMLKELGDCSPSQGNVSEKEARLKSMLVRLKVELIIIDEVHDYLPKSGRGKPSAALAWLKGLMDELMIPMVFMGTDLANYLRTGDRELASRVHYSGQLSSLSYGKANPTKYEFAELATAFGQALPRDSQKFQFMSHVNGKVKLLNVHMCDRLYVATRGLPRALRDFFLELHTEMHINPEFEPNLINLAELYSNLSSMNDELEFDPFSKINYSKVKAYIK